MSVIVYCVAEPNDLDVEFNVRLEYGTMTNDLFDLDRLLKGSKIKAEDCKLHLFALDGNMQHGTGATHVAAICTGSDPKVGNVVMMDGVIDGPFFLMFAVGERLKGFHCHDCAKGFMEKFIDSQQLWIDIHHASRSKKDEVQAKTYH